jgi:opacity protein-like surface antigen
MVALFALAGAHDAGAQEFAGPWYAAIRGGAIAMQKLSVSGLNLSASPLLPAPTNIVSYKPGWTASIAGGITADEHSRLEIEIGETRSAVRRAFGDPSTIPGLGSCALANPNCASVGPTGGNTHAETYMVQGYYDFSTPWPVAPFVGVGLGVANIHEKQVGQPRGVLLEGSTGAFAYAAIGGFAFRVTPNIAIDVAYRYFGTTSQHFRANRFGTPGADFQSHALIVGLRYGFV